MTQTTLPTQPQARVYDINRFPDAPFIDFNDEQKKVVEALLETLVPCLSQKEEEELVAKLCSSPNSPYAEESVRKFAHVSGNTPESIEAFKHIIFRTVSPDKHSEVLGLLSHLSTPQGTQFLSGRNETFYDLNREEREKILLEWKTSPVSQQRSIHSTLSTIGVTAVYSVDSKLRSILGLETMDEKKEEPWEPKRENLKRFPLIDPPKEALHYDAIVVGSGGGGGVAVAKLAEGGKSVLVIEKGKYFHEDDFVRNESVAYSSLYESGGFTSSRDGSILTSAGSVIGGGTTVNWSISLKTQHFVREEWARQGLDHFVSPKFAEDLEKVCQRIGASTEGIRHNVPNQIMIDGCKNLGYHIEPAPQNTGGKPHECAYCLCGCQAGIKNGTMRTWLRDAIDHNAKFLTETKVMRVLMKDNKAIGVECRLKNGELVNIYADTVVVSAGSLSTPGVLLRSGLTNKHIGQNLYLHPGVILFGAFDQTVDSHIGSISTTLSNVAENIDGEGYGVKLEIPAARFSSYSTLNTWRGAVAHKEIMMKYRNASPSLVLLRDKHPKACVKYDENNNHLFEYELSKHDEKSIVIGVMHSCKVLVAAGARSIMVSQGNIDPFVFNDDEESRVDNPRFKEWLDAMVKFGYPTDSSIVLSAHQMGTCRMGISPDVSVTKPTGETWEVKNLYVADASLFPTSSGVNPMVTVEAIALHVADSILSA
ncbi:hypothetical protein BDF14DRAFT_1841216 [Spinellus fusiger]|nr:hypothetical protein BDF14DRAFT_1841216 [Spinellus fusiger]